MQYEYTKVNYEEVIGGYRFYEEYTEEGLKVKGIGDILPVLNHYGLKGWEFICWDNGGMIFKRIIKEQSEVSTVNGEGEDGIKGIGLILDEPILKGLIEEGVKILEYKNNTLYYELNGLRLKSEKSLPEIEVYSLVLKLAGMNGVEFNKSKPILEMKGEGVKVIAHLQEEDGEIYFYVDLG